MLKGSRLLPGNKREPWFSSRKTEGKQDIPILSRNLASTVNFFAKEDL